MLDLKVIRSDPQRVKEAMHNRNKDIDNLIDQLLEADAALRALNTETDTLKAKQNKTSKEIPILKGIAQQSATICKIDVDYNKTAKSRQSCPTL